MIVLPKGAFTVLADKPIAVTDGGIILDEQSQEPVNTGKICYTHVDLNKYQGCKVVFRINHAEEIKIKGIDHLYFRDFDSSIFYLIEE